MDSNGQELEYIPFYEVFVSEDAMRADIVFHKPAEGQEAMSFSDVVEEIKSHGLCYGVREDILKKVLILKLYERKVSFAYGTEAENGKDGYFEFLFKTEFDRKPAILEDGNADYMNFETYAKVNKGDPLVIYHPAESGIPGHNVWNEQIDAFSGVELAKMDGEGFRILPDGVTYVSEYNGKAEFTEGKLIVTAIHEIFGDVSAKTGNVDFDGDILVHGKVRSGMMVEATGSITVEGILEAATVVAGEDVILKAGAMGNGTGAVLAKGDVFGKFYEKMEIHSGKTVFCDYAMHSKIYAQGSVVVTGTKGSIIGGVTYGRNSVECMNVSNEKNVMTLIQSGVSKDILFDYFEAKQTIPLLSQRIKEAEDKLRKMHDPILSEECSANKEKLKKYEGMVKSAEKELEETKGSYIIANGTAYQGTILEISVERYAIAEEKTGCMFLVEDGYIQESDIREHFTS